MAILQSGLIPSDGFMVVVPAISTPGSGTFIWRYLIPPADPGVFWESAGPKSGPIFRMQTSPIMTHLTGIVFCALL